MITLSNESVTHDKTAHIAYDDDYTVTKRYQNIIYSAYNLYITCFSL